MAKLLEKSLGWLGDLVAQHVYREDVPEPQRRRWSLDGPDWQVTDDPDNEVLRITALPVDASRYGIVGTLPDEDPIDTSEAFQTAVDDLPEGSILVLKGGLIYTLNTSITLEKAITILGFGLATITGAPDAQGLLQVEASDVTFEKILFQYSGDFENANCVYVTGTDFTAVRCKATGAIVDGFQVQPETDGGINRLVYCHCYANGRAGAMSRDNGRTVTSTMVAEGGVYENNGTGAGDGYGVTFANWRSIVFGGRFTGNKTNQVECDGSIATDAFVVQDCLIEMTGDLIAENTYGINAINHCPNILIARTTIRGSLSSDDDQVAAILVQGDHQYHRCNERVVLYDNAIENFAHIQSAILIRAVDCKDLIVRENRITDCGLNVGSSSYWLQITHGLEHVTTNITAGQRGVPRHVYLEGNDIRNCPAALVSVGAHVRIDGNSFTHYEQQDEAWLIGTEKYALGRVEIGRNSILGADTLFNPSLDEAPTFWTWEKGDRREAVAITDLPGVAGWITRVPGSAQAVAGISGTTVDGEQYIHMIDDASNILPGDWLVSDGGTFGNDDSPSVQVVDIDGLVCTVDIVVGNPVVQLPVDGTLAARFSVGQRLKIGVITWNGSPWAEIDSIDLTAQTLTMTENPNDNAIAANMYAGRAQIAMQSNDTGTNDLTFQEATFAILEARDAPSDFNPTMIEGCTLWLEAGWAVYDSGRKILNWPDHSDLGEPAFFQDTAGNRPSYVNESLSYTGIGGRPAILFTAASSHFLLSPGIVRDLMTGGVGNDWTLFAVANVTTVATNDATVYNNPAIIAEGGGYWGLYLKNTSPPTALVYLYDGAIKTAATEFNLTEDTRFVIAQGSGNIYSYCSGSAVLGVTAAGAISDASGAMLIGRGFGGPQYFNGKMSAVIGYNRHLTTEEQDRLNAWIDARWGI